MQDGVKQYGTFNKIIVSTKMLSSTQKSISASIVLDHLPRPPKIKWFAPK